jgi:hypothetical protein
MVHLRDLGPHRAARRAVRRTVDEGLLADAREASGGKPDAALLDAALRAFLLRYRAAEHDATDASYDAHPLDEPDEWGHLASLRTAAAAS